MVRMLGLGILLAASTSAAAAEPPILNDFALREASAAAIDERPLAVRFDAPRADFAEPARPARRQGFLAAVQVVPNGFLGIGLSDRKLRRSAFAPDPWLDGQRGGKKLALRFNLGF